MGDHDGKVQGRTGVAENLWHQTKMNPLSVDCSGPMCGRLHLDSPARGRTSKRSHSSIDGTCGL